MDDVLIFFGGVLLIKVKKSAKLTASRSSATAKTAIEPTVQTVKKMLSAPEHNTDIKALFFLRIETFSPLLFDQFSNNDQSAVLEIIIAG